MKCGESSETSKGSSGNPNSTNHGSDGSNVQKADLERYRCFGDLLPDLNGLSNGDTVLIAVDSIQPGVLPGPLPSTPVDSSLGWSQNDKYVRLPFSSESTFDEGRKYSRIEEALAELITPLKSHYELEDCIRTINSACRWNLDMIGYLFENVFNTDERKEYLEEVIPFMAKLALSAPTLITQPIPLLRRGFIGSVTLSQQQVAALLSHAFFCTFERRKDWGYAYPSINFNQFFDCRNYSAVEKLRCILYYFRSISKEMPCGVISYRRQSTDAPNWKTAQGALCDFVVLSEGTIEDDGFGMLQMDFANEYIGGGVLGQGCVQEEIRFAISPELILSRLFCERMSSKEAIFIAGAERYSDYTGYGGNFKWCPRKKDNVLRDRFERYLCEIVAIDALCYSRRQEQYDVRAVNRELQKAYSGFYAGDGSKKCVATGNWGCGAFGGDPYLKAVVQLMAASANGRPLCYFTFYDKKLARELRSLYAMLKSSRTTIGGLYEAVVSYCADYSSRRSAPPLLAYIGERIGSQGASCTV